MTLKSCLSSVKGNRVVVVVALGHWINLIIRCYERQIVEVWTLYLNGNLDDSLRCCNILQSKTDGSLAIRDILQEGYIHTNVIVALSLSADNSLVNYLAAETEFSFEGRESGMVLISTVYIETACLAHLGIAYRRGIDEWIALKHYVLIVFVDTSRQEWKSGYHCYDNSN